MAKQKKKLPVLHPSVSLVDTHCHLDMDSYSSDFRNILSSAFDNGIRSIITIGIDISSSRKAVDLAEKFSMIHATVGIHPHDVGNITNKDLETLSFLIDEHRNSIVGYGEIGLDYVKNYSPHDQQRKYFADQLALARNHKLPVVIHDREAHDDILRILREYGPFDHGGIMHCFSGDIEYAQKVLDLGFHISIPGIVTFKNAKALKEVAEKIPLQSLLLETDGPFLAPDPYRGKRNEPLYLLYTADEVARLRNLTIEETAAATTANALKLFNFSLPIETGL